MNDSVNRYGYPSGDEGEEMLDEMNDCHTPMALWGLTNIEFNDDDLALDIGCGGGINIFRIHHKSPNAMTYGVDYSSTSVKKSTEFNRELVDKGEVKILEANVLDMPFDDDMFDVVTAFETIYFWPDLKKSFCEVKRILQMGGRFFMEIVSNDDDYVVDLEEDPKMEGFKPLNENMLKEILEEVGFSSITINLRKPDSNKKLVRTFTKESFTEECVDDDFDYSKYNYDESENRTWLCIIAEK